MEAQNFSCTLSIIDSDSVKLFAVKSGNVTAFAGVADNKAVSIITSMDRMSQLLLRAVNNRTRERNYFRLYSQLLDKEISDDVGKAGGDGEGSTEPEIVGRTGILPAEAFKFDCTGVLL